MARGERDVLAEIEAGEIAPVYALCGPEMVLVDRAAAALRDQVVPAATRAWNYDVFEGNETTGETIARAVRTLPMMAKRRLIHVRRADKLSASDHAPLLALLAAPPPEAVLLLVGEKFDARLKLFAQIKKVGAFAKFEAPYENRIPQWIEIEARRQKAKLQGGAAVRLAELCGRDLGRIVSVLEQLSIGAGDGPITVSAIDALVFDSRERTVFELCDAIFSADRARTRLVMRKMIDQRESFVGAVAMLARHARQLTKIKGLGAGASPDAVAAALGISPFFATPLIAQARQLPEPAIRSIFAALAQTDWALKSGEKSALGEPIVMERLVQQIWHALAEHKKQRSAA